MAGKQAYVVTTSKKNVYHTSKSCRYVQNQPEDKVRPEDLTEIKTHEWWDDWGECKVCSGEAANGQTGGDGIFLKIQRIRAEKDGNKLTLEDLHG